MLKFKDKLFKIKKYIHMKLNTYLTFNGNCRAAMEYYKNVLGGEFEGGIKTFADGGEHMKYKPKDADKIMHVHLKTDDFSIMGSDNVGDQFPFIGGNNFSMSLTIDDENKAQKTFDRLADKGKTMMPLADAFWGGKFGMLVDQFGIQWMVSTSHL